MKLNEYPSWDNNKLLLRMGEVVQQIVEAEVELAYTRSGELAAKVDSYTHSKETSITARDNAARYAAATHTYSVYDLESRIRALTEEKWYIIKCLELAVG